MRRTGQTGGGDDKQNSDQLGAPLNAQFHRSNGSGADARPPRGRHYLCLMNIGTDLVTLAFDQPAVAGAGWALEGASADGHQGGSMCWDGATVASSVVHAISPAGSAVAVLEGR